MFFQALSNYILHAAINLDRKAIEIQSQIICKQSFGSNSSQYIGVIGGLMGQVSQFSLLVFMAAAVMIVAVGLATDDQDAAVAGVGCSPLPTYAYVNATAFTENLDSVLQFLLSNLSDGFATSRQNKSGKTDPVYGLAVCRKYLSASECSKCIKEAAIQVNTSCPRSNGGRIHLDGCFFRYENSSFYEQSVDGGTSSNCSSTNESNNQTFYQNIEDLYAQLITNVSANNSYDVAGSLGGGSLYGLAQCWPSLTDISSCRFCLHHAQEHLLSCSPHREGRGLEAGCFMRYSTYSFFTHNQTSSSSVNSTPSTLSKIGRVWGTALVAVLCLLFCGRI